ncbi:MAG: alcohol dehydrogenase catalytic domain-containing protein [Sphaerochaetaceae bacterium]
MNLQNRIFCVCAPGKLDILTSSITSLLPQQVVVEVKNSAICGSDVHIFKGKHPSCSLPVTIGHEFSGIIIEKGAFVQGFQIGDRVTVEPSIACGRCARCLQGEYNYCKDLTFTYRVGHGSMADFVVVDERNLHLLPPDVSFTTGALIEPLAVAIHAVRKADIQMAKSVVVIGAGPIGLLITAICKEKGASSLVVVDHNQYRLDFAKNFGADHTINSRTENAREQILMLTNGEGFDRSFECVGCQETLENSIEWLRPGGISTVVGIFEDQRVSVPITHLVSREIKVQGTQGYCWDFPVALQICNKIKIERLVTHKFAMENLDQAFQTVLERNKCAVKVVLSSFSS